MTEDKLLVEQARNGSQKAFSELFNRHRRNIWWIAFKIVKNLDAADDITSMSFTKAFTKLDTYLDHISFEMWLKTIAINTAIDYLRRNKKENLNNYIDDEDNPLQLEETASSPEKEFTDKEDLSIAYECISRLKAKHRKLLEMKINGMTYQQIADELAMPEATVKGDLNKARRRLRELINNY